MEEVKILPINPETFETQEYNPSDEKLLTVSTLDTVFNGSTDYIELSVYDENKNQIYSTPEGENLTSYTIEEGNVILNPKQNLIDLDFDINTYFSNYNFYRKRLSSSSSLRYFISEVSSNRTEIRLDSTQIDITDILNSANEFIQYRDEAEYFVDFKLNFGSNQILIANNLKIDNDTVLIKLYEPLPSQFDVKSQLWVVEEISTPQAYQVTFPFIVEAQDDFTFISGPNFNLNISQETGESSQTFSYDGLLNSNVTSSLNQIQSLLNEKEINININYEDFNEFVHFSSAKTRLENFYYKVGLIESKTNELSDFLSLVTSDTTGTTSYSSSKASIVAEIDDIIKNFDGHEYFMYFNSGSSFSYPKSNTEPPFQLYSTGSSQALNWVGSADEESPYYGGLALSASNYDENNRDRLYSTIPEYLREDPDNSQYDLFIDMVGQHYDNVWLYTKDITNKFDADNRLEYGISKDLVSEAIKDFGIKLYSNNFNSDDLFSAFLGLTPSGSLFPFPQITSSLPTPSGFEYVDTKVSSSNNVIPLEGVNKRLYKRIYHNLPYLLKTKGTIPGLRALITSYGIPDTILRINEFGGKDRNESQDWDLNQNTFNYGFSTNNLGSFQTRFKNYFDSFDTTGKFEQRISSGTGSVESLGCVNPLISSPPSSIQLRFKTDGIPSPVNNIASSNIRYSQSLLSTHEFLGNAANFGGILMLEYTGSGLVTGSYSGSVADPNDYYGTLKWIPSLNSPEISASVYLPFFDGDWWSVQINVDNSNLTRPASIGEFEQRVLDDGGTLEAIGNLNSFLKSPTNSTLQAANQIDGKIGFVGSDEATNFIPNNWNNSTTSSLNLNVSNISIGGKSYQPLSGSYQELRYWSQELSQSHFYDYVVNPYSIEGNGINSSPDQLYFRADLGTQLNENSRTSIHPRVTGSTNNITSSFTDGTSTFTINNPVFTPNTEQVFQDQVPSGIKNRITDKIKVESPILAENVKDSNPDITVLSPMRSIQQDSYVSQSYTPDIDYLEVAFSPQDQINDDINAQLGYFNIGDYIGDPRHISSSNRSYPDLDKLRDAYFDKYIKSYDVVDFIRLMKFFDNSLFKMIKDFTPARTSLSSGVVVKQHILERNRQTPVQTSLSNETYSGSIKPQVRNFNTGSGDVGQYEYTGGSSIYKFSGGPGGSTNRYNGLQTSPSASDYNLINNFDLTQSYEEIKSGLLGKETVTIFNQDEFYNGEFKGSDIVATTQSLNPQCEPYLRVANTPVQYKPLFFNSSIGDTGGTEAVVSETAFIQADNHPSEGEAWVLSKTQNPSPLLNIITDTDVPTSATPSTGLIYTFQSEVAGPSQLKLTLYDAEAGGTYPNYSGTQASVNGVALKTRLSGSNNATITFYETVQLVEGENSLNIWSSNTEASKLKGAEITSPRIVSTVRLASIDDLGNTLDQYLDDSNVLRLIQPTGDVVEYHVTGFIYLGDSIVLKISDTQGDFNVYSSPNGGTKNWSLSVSGSYTSSLGTGNDSKQGVFNDVNTGDQAQDIFFWGDQAGNSSTVQDALGFFNVGSPSINFSQINNNPTYYNYGSYNIKETPNINWFFSCSVSYSASFASTTSTTTTPGIYHTGSNASFGGAFLGTSGDSQSTPTLSFIPEPTQSISQDLSNTIFSSFGVPGNAYGAGDTYFDTLNYFGHPRILTAGTASFDFYFPPLTLSGSQTSYAPIINPAYLSGSNGTNSFNETYLTQFGLSTEMFELSQDRGTIVVNQSGVIDRATQRGITNFQPQTDSMKFQMALSCSVQNVTGSIEVRKVVILNNQPTIVRTNTFVTVKANSQKEIIFDTDYFDISIPNATETAYESLANIKLESPEVNFTYTFYNNPAYNSSEIRYLATGVDNYGTPQGLNEAAWESNSNSIYARFQPLSSPFTSSITASLGVHPTVDVQAFLKRTGSGIPSTGYIITASNKLTNQTLDDGSTFTFTDGQILDIENTALTSSTTSSTINSVGDMYYVEYVLDNVTAGTLPDGSSDTRHLTLFYGDNTKIAISQSIDTPTVYNLTGSIYLKQNTPSNPNVSGGSRLQPGEDYSQFIVPNETTSGTATLAGSIDNLSFRYNDAFRMGVHVEKGNNSGLTITSYTMSIFPSQSEFSTLPNSTPSYGNFKEPISTPFIVPTYFGDDVLPFQYSLDCQPLLNNANSQRPSTFLYDINYNDNSIVPSNLGLILDKTATKATVPDSNYTAISSTSLKYEGSKASSQYLNVWSPSDIGTFGKLPAIESRDAHFGYFNDISDSYPLLNNKTKINLNYLIDQEGNALPPSLENNISRDIFEKTFPGNGAARISISSGSQELQELNTLKPIFKIGQYPAPIMYTQTSSRGHATIIPITGSGIISMYDGNSSTAFADYSFTAFGTSSLGNTTLGTASFTEILNPSENVNFKKYDGGSYQAYTASSGIISFNSESRTTAGDDTSQQHFIDLETSVPTSYIYDSDYNRNGSFFRKHKHKEKLELTLTLGLLYETTESNSQKNIPFVLEDIGLKVWKTDGQSFDLGSVSDKVKYVQKYQEIINTPTFSRGLRKTTSTIINKYGGGYGIALNSSKQAEIQIDNDIVVSILKDNGFASSKGVEVGGDIAGLEWTLKANSSDNLYQSGSSLSWQLEGSMHNLNGQGKNNIINPPTFTGPRTPTSITMRGSKTHLLESNNSGLAPFWVFGSELTGNAAIPIGTSGSNILFMSSSNMNEAYGDSYKQGTLPYTIGDSEFFPGGTEPTGTTIGETFGPLRLEVNDEIRFANNESYSYKIVNVTPPSKNIMGDDVGRLKIELDRKLPFVNAVLVNNDVDSSLNKDFFLVRRYIDNINTIYLDSSFPYGKLPTVTNSPGILFPDFPTEYLQNSASAIVTDLINKGVIES